MVSSRRKNSSSSRSRLALQTGVPDVDALGLVVDLPLQRLAAVHEQRIVRADERFEQVVGLDGETALVVGKELGHGLGVGGELGLQLRSCRRPAGPGR